MSRRNAFTLVELLVVIAIIAVLLAVLLPSLRNAKSLGQRLQCQSRLKNIGNSVAVYANQYDDRMPAYARDSALNFSHEGRYIHAHYIYAQLDRDSTTNPKQIYYNGPGSLWKSGIVPDGRSFYCPAVQGWREEYNQYTNPTPWGTLPQAFNTTISYEVINAYKGYVYWPQSRKPMKQPEYDSLASVLKGIRYVVGNPYSPYVYADLDPGRSMAIDYTPHTIQGSGYNLNVLFGDGHVVLNRLPKDIVTGKYWQCYQSYFIKDLDPPYGANPVPASGNQYWTGEIPITTYMMKFQP
jgi:prepilin-type N-terminal cleavage/methylation domain-containing protein/prepilin-type processing-associated H-X9-DG protein